MSEYDNTNSGALFKNDEKREGKKDPDYKGSVNVEGTEYWVSSWINTAKSGKKYMALKLKAKESRQESAAPAPVAEKPGTDPEFDDEIPFAFAILAPFAGLMAAATYAAKDLL